MEFKEFLEAFKMWNELNGNKQELKQEQNSDFIGKYCVIRARDAGVHCGYLVSYKGREVVLKNSRRLYRWYINEGISLSAVADSGVKYKDSKVACEVENLLIADACEILVCTDAAKDSLIKAPIAQAV